MPVHRRSVAVVVALLTAGLTLLAATAAGAESAARGNAKSAPSSIDRFEVHAMAPSPRYACAASRHRTVATCRVDEALAAPRRVVGTTTFKGSPPLKGDITIVYNQYSFAGALRFARRPGMASSGWRLHSAAGRGQAQATWSMTFADQARSQLRGTFLSRDIRLRRSPGGRAALAVDYTVTVSGGTGRFAGLTDACPPGRCHYRVGGAFPVNGPGQLGSAVRAASARALGARVTPMAPAADIDVGLAAGDPRVELALPSDGVLAATDPRPLQATAPPGATCTGLVDDLSTGTSTDLGEVVADAQGTVLFPGHLAPLIPADAESPGVRVTVACTSPPAPVLVAIVPAVQPLRNGGRRPPPSYPAVARIANDSSFRLNERSHPSNWRPPGVLGAGGSGQVAFSTWFFDPWVSARYHYEGHHDRSGIPHSEGWIDLRLNARDRTGSCDVQVEKAGPSKATCEVRFIDRVLVVVVGQAAT
jgi:hypothetical protein